MTWYLKYLKDLAPAMALDRATASLKDARNAKDQRHALKFCNQAKESLKRIHISSASPLDLNHIIAKYREHGAVLEKWGFSTEAQHSYSKVEELRYSKRV